MTEKTMIKKILMGILVVCLVAGFYFLPVIVQRTMSEVLTQNGGYIEQGYTVVSLREMMDNSYCSFFCFPSTDQTRTFNYIALMVESLLVLSISGYLIWRITKH